MKNENWKPIIETLGIDEKYHELAINFAQKLNDRINENSNLQSLENLKSIENNLLPLNLKIFSKLNLDRDIEILSEPKQNNVEVDDIEFTEKIITENHKDLTAKELVEKFENVLVDKLVDYINQTDGKLYIYELVSSVSMISEKNWNPMGIFRSRISIV